MSAPLFHDVHSIWLRRMAYTWGHEVFDSLVVLQYESAFAGRFGLQKCTPFWLHYPWDLASYLDFLALNSRVVPSFEDYV